MKFRKLGELSPFKKSIRIKHGSCTGLEYYNGSQAPCVEDLPNCLRIWFSARDTANQSHPFYHVVPKDDLLHIVDTCYEPQLPLGSAGEADENGVMLSQVLPDRFIYTGWNKTWRPDVRFRTSLMECSRKSGVKIVHKERELQSECGTSMQFCKPQQDVFMSVYKWQEGEPYYTINYECHDEYYEYFVGSGRAFDFDPSFCYARPILFCIDQVEYLFYSKRSAKDYRDNPENSYKIYVRKEWYKPDSVEKLVEIEGEDSPKMLAYGYPIKLDNKIIMFYNTSFTGPISVAEWII